MTMRVVRGRSLGWLLGMLLAVVGIVIPSAHTGSGTHTGAGGSAPSETSNPYLIGTNYFSGWWQDPNPHFALPDGSDMRTSHPELEPKYGWYDDSQAVVDQQILDAASDGIDFFSFDWYPDRPGRGAGVGTGLSNGLDFFRTSPNRGLMKFSLDYVGHDPFDLRYLRTAGMTYTEWDQVRTQAWNDMVDQWVSIFQDPNYLTIDGKPVFEIYDVQTLQLDFSDDQYPGLDGHALAQIPSERAILQAAIQTLRDKVAAAGFPGIVIGGILDQPGLDGAYVQAHDDGTYDFFTAYNRIPNGRVSQQDNDYNNLIREHHDYVWDYYAKYKAPTTDYVPIITAGWNDLWKPQQPNWQVDRSPQAFGDFLREARTYLDGHPQTNISSEPVKIAMIASWNEVAEGHSIEPTMAEGDAYLRQVGDVFGFSHPELQTPIQYGELQQAITDLHDYADSLGLAPADQVQIAACFAVIGLQMQGLQDALDDVQQSPTAPVSITKQIDDEVAQVASILTGAGADTPTVEQKHQAVVDHRDSLLRVALGIDFQVEADDYAPTSAQTVTLHVKATNPQDDQSPTEWSVQVPGSWSAPPATSGSADAGQDVPVDVPDDPAGGTTYNVNGVLPGKGDLTGSLQRLTVHASLKYGGDWISEDIPLALTVLPDLDKRVTTVTSPGSTTATVIVQDLKTSALNGTIRVDAPSGVTSAVTGGSATVSLSGGSQATTTVELATTSTTATQQASIYFDATGGGSTLLGEVDVQPAAPNVTTLLPAPDGDATLRVKDGQVIVVTNNTSNLQVGPADNTEYRMVVTFDLSSFTDASMQKALLDLTEYHSVSPGDLLLEHIDSSGTISGSAYDSPALDSASVLPGELGVGSTIKQRSFDVTSWVAQDLAAGKAYSTFRFRIEGAVPSATAGVRQFRPVEYTPDDASDAPQLLLTAG